MSGLFDMSRFTPHGFCLAWQPDLVWLLALSNFFTALAYFSIPAALVVFLRKRRDLVFKPIFGLFAAFILACGTTHIIGTLTLWVPVYWLDGLVNAVTAVLSVATATALWPLLPKALALPSPGDLHKANAALAREAASRAEAIERLRESEARRRVLYARTPAALHAANAYGVIIDVSDRWLELAGYERDEVIGRNVTEFYEPESARASVEQTAALRAGGAIVTRERRMRCGNGRIRDLELVGEAERDAQGVLQRIHVAVYDVTARKETETALRQTEERLRHAQKMEAVGQLTGGIAHDFNNLLTSIMGSLELLQQRTTLDERAGQLAAKALDGSRRAARLVSQLLSFSRRQLLLPERLSPVEVVRGIHDLLAQTLGERITLEIKHDLTGWLALADRNQVEAALLNLVINSRDAIDGRGHVIIEIADRTLDRVTLQGSGGYMFDAPEQRREGDFVSISVADNGCGMTADVQARAFEPFFTTKPQGAGTGLGLSQIYGFVSQSGGAVRLITEPGEGTTVEMLLPRAAGPGAGSEWPGGLQPS